MLFLGNYLIHMANLFTHFVALSFSQRLGFRGWRLELILHFLSFVAPLKSLSAFSLVWLDARLSDFVSAVQLCVDDKPPLHIPALGNGADLLAFPVHHE